MVTLTFSWDRLVGEAVVVDRTGRRVDALGELFDFGARSAGGVIDYLVYVTQEFVHAEAVDDLVDPACSGQVGCDLGAKVAGRLAFRPDLGEYQPEYVVDYFPALDELHRRDDHAFLEDLLECAHRRRRTAPNVHVVCQAGRVSGQLALPVDRPDEADVVQMNAAAIRVVGEDHVPRAELVHTMAPDGAGDVLHE